MSSMDEYNQTRRIPNGMQFDGGPAFHRAPLVDIVGGAVTWKWDSEDGVHRIIYRQPADPDNMTGRTVFVLSMGDPAPLSAGVQLREAIMPDDPSLVGYVEFGKPIPPILLVFKADIGPRFPGWN